MSGKGSLIKITLTSLLLLASKACFFNVKLSTICSASQEVALLCVHIKKGLVGLSKKYMNGIPKWVGYVALRIIPLGAQSSPRAAPSRLDWAPAGMIS